MNIRILVIEKDTNQAKQITDELNKVGYSTNIAFGYFDAMRIINFISIDLIISEIDLDEDRDGIQVISDIKKERNIPVIFLTSRSDQVTLTRATPISNAYLLKPFHLNQVVASINVALKDSPDDSYVLNDAIFMRKDGNSTFRKVFLKDILYLEADRAYTNIYTTENKFTQSSSMNVVHRKINAPSFIQVHRSYVVNLDNVEGLKGNILIIGFNEIPIGERYKQDVRKRLGFLDSLPSHLSQQKEIVQEEVKKNLIPQIVSKKILATFSPEGDHNNPDRLNFQSDINAIANLIAYEKVTPPLAIGLFGNWGTGKSFFMSKLENRINELSISEHDTYCKNIVHVRFNSWHYSDANLWASLISEIFDSLNSFAKGEEKTNQIKKILYEKLETSKHLLEETESKRRKVQKEIGELNAQIIKTTEERAKKAKSLKSFKFSELIDVVFEEPEIQSEVSSIAENLGVDNLKSIKMIDESASELEGSYKFVKAFVKTVNKLNWKQILFLIIIPTGIFFISKFLGVYLSNNQELTSRIGPYLFTLSTILLQLRILMRPTLHSIKNIHRRLISLRHRIDLLVEKKISERTSEEQSLSYELNQLVTFETELCKEVMIKSLEVNELNFEIEEIKSGKRLTKFIEEKSKNSRYKDHLGIISWIRKDFQELDIQLKTQEEFSENSKEEFKIDRIILYIDDLDRCSETRVVEVLEAVHLILAFKLFAVVVGVDPRWVGNALNHKYPHLVDSNNNLGQKGSNKSSATTFDYLEKIFQIPFSLRDIQEESAKEFIRDIAKQGYSDIELEVDASAIDNKNEANETANKVGRDSTSEELDDLKSKVLEKLEALDITDQELEVMENISKLIGNTPRSIKRYINVYKILRSHDELDVTTLDESKSVMILLAFITSWPNLVSEILTGIKEKDQTLLNTLNNIEDSEDKTTLISILKQENMSWIAETRSIALSKNLNLISRFSFRTIGL